MARTEDVGTDSSEEQIPTLGKDAKRENIEEVRIKETKQMRVLNREEMEREAKMEGTLFTIPRGSNVAEQDTRREIEALRTAMRKHRFFKKTSLNDLEQKYKLDTGCVLTEKVKLALPTGRAALLVHEVSKALLKAGSQKKICRTR